MSYTINFDLIYDIAMVATLISLTITAIYIATLWHYHDLNRPLGVNAKMTKSLSGPISTDEAKSLLENAKKYLLDGGATDG